MSWLKMKWSWGNQLYSAVTLESKYFLCNLFDLIKCYFFTFLWHVVKHKWSKFVALDNVHGLQFTTHCLSRLERKTLKRKKVLATLKVLWSVIEDMTKEISPEDAKNLISEEVCIPILDIWLFVFVLGVGKFECKGCSMSIMLPSSLII